MTDLAITTEERTRMTAASRFDKIRDLIRTAEQMRLTACALLADAERHEDWQDLGLDNMTAYVETLGIPQSTGAKMLTAGRVFASDPEHPDWEALPEADQQELTVNRLYLSAQRVDRGQVDATTALHDAVANPPEALVAMRDGTEPYSSHRCVCPDCGNEHFAPNDSAEPDADLPF